jgi:hypothetical protein
MDEMDGVYDRAYARAPHPSYGKARIPAWEMIRFSSTSCAVVSVAALSVLSPNTKAASYKAAQNLLFFVKSKKSATKSKALPAPFLISAAQRRICIVSPAKIKNRRILPSAFLRLSINLYKSRHRSQQINLDLSQGTCDTGREENSDQSGLRYDLAVRSPEYVKELVTHHVGGLLKIAPEHTEADTLSKMMKPGIGSYDEFKQMFEKYSREANKEQYLIPYFIAAHPGSTDEDMVNLAIWLKKNDFKLDQVQTFMPTPMALATTMYHTRKNPLKKVTRILKS